MKNQNQKHAVYVFIDASNIWQAQKAKGRFFDYEKLRRFLKNSHKADVIKVFYFTAFPADGTRDYSIDGKHKFFTYLKKGLGFIVRKKELKRIAVSTEEGDAIKEKGDMDVEISIDALHHKDKYDTAIFFTGDSDFRSKETFRGLKLFFTVVFQEFRDNFKPSIFA